jgi:hypothetical protein
LPEKDRRGEQTERDPRQRNHAGRRSRWQGGIHLLIIDRNISFVNSNWGQTSQTRWAEDDRHVAKTLVWLLLRCKAEGRLASWVVSVSRCGR